MRLVLASLLILSGCSSSDDGVVSGSGPDSDVVPSFDAGVVSDSDEAALAEEVVVTAPAPVAVTFNITVPVIVSNMLQVRLQWGEREFTAQWIGDEFWSVTDEFPPNTENPLSITFFDGNGETVLASFEQSYRSGQNGAEVFDVMADQFDSAKWDSDGDGVSNLDESVAGTNVFVNESAVNESIALEVREKYFGPNIQRVSNFYEEDLPEQRPYFEQFEDLPAADANFNSDRRTQRITIDIDEFGTGSYSDTFRFAGAGDRDITIVDQEASRTRTSSSVIWSGTYMQSNSGAGVSNDFDFTIETTSIDAVTRMQIGSYTKDSEGEDTSRDEVVAYSLVGKINEDSSLCEAVAGSITYEYDFEFISNSAVDTVTKELDDQYWKVVVSSVDGQIEEEYLAESLATGFTCDFPELR